jgi:YfiH family protein
LAPRFRQPSIFRAFPGLIAAESTRHGGVSTASFQSLNAGIFTGDKPENILENRRRLFQDLSIREEQVAHSHQVHGHRILFAEKAGLHEGYDALITNRKDLFLSVTVADCTPILVFDPKHSAVAAIHAGWRGTVERIVEKSLLAMREAYGTQPADCLAYIGTCIDECSYEVGEEVAGLFDPAFSQKGEQAGKYLLDLKAANAEQLKSAGLREANLEISPYSTVLHNDDYFSYRKENGQTGRMLALIGMKSPG